MSTVKVLLVLLYASILQYTNLVTLLQMLHREETIKQLQEDLMESQTQYSACYNEVSHTVVHSSSPELTPCNTSIFIPALTSQKQHKA